MSNHEDFSLNYEKRLFFYSEMCKLCLKSSNDIGLQKRDISRLKSILALRNYSQTFENRCTLVCVFCWRQINKSLNFITMVQNANEFWVQNQANQLTQKKSNINISIINLTKNNFLLSIPENTFEDNKNSFFNNANSKLIYFTNIHDENIDIKPDVDVLEDDTYNACDDVDIDIKNHNIVDNDDELVDIDEDLTFTENFDTKDGLKDVVLDNNTGNVKSFEESLKKLLNRKKTKKCTNIENKIDENLLIGDKSPVEIALQTGNINNLIVFKELNAKSTQDLEVLNVKDSELLVIKDEEILKKINIKEVILSEKDQLKEVEDRKRAKKYLEAKFKCDMCGWFGINADTKAKHMERHSELAGRYECNKCKCRFKTDTSLLSHTKLHKYNWVCLKCNFVLTGRHKCERHYTYCSGEGKPVKCHLCNKSVRNSYSLEKHLRHHAVGMKYKCDHCKKHFQTKQRIRYHIYSVHMQIKPFECNLCTKKLSSLAALKKHTRTHENFVKGESNYCVECNQYFKYLEQHCKRKHGNQEKRFVCDFCSKRFFEGFSLQIHRNTIHLNNRNYCCQLCPKKYGASGNLLEHMKRTHLKTERVRSHVCSVCGKGFFKKGSLLDHMNTHTNERPYKCELCTATFNFSAALYTHNKLKHKLKKTSS